jgi:regulatory protein
MDQFEKFYALSLKYLSYRVRSEKEVREYLLKKNSPPEILEKIIATLKKQRFLNDEEFARMWVESRNRAKPRASRVLKYELQQKGVAQDIIEKFVSSKGQSDLDSAKSIVQKRLPRLKNLQKEEIYKKLGGHLARKGYNWDVIKRSIDDCLGKEYNM